MLLCRSTHFFFFFSFYLARWGYAFLASLLVCVFFLSGPLFGCDIFCSFVMDACPNFYMESFIDQVYVWRRLFLLFFWSSKIKQMSLSILLLMTICFSWALQRLSADEAIMWCCFLFIWFTMIYKCFLLYKLSCCVCTFHSLRLSRQQSFVSMSIKGMCFPEFPTSFFWCGSGNYKLM